MCSSLLFQEMGWVMFEPFVYLLYAYCKFMKLTMVRFPVSLVFSSTQISCFLVLILAVSASSKSSHLYLPFLSLFDVSFIYTLIYTSLIFDKYIQDLLYFKTYLLYSLFLLKKSKACLIQFQFNSI